MPGSNYPYTNLDAEQAIKQSFDEVNDALRYIMAGGSLVPENYDKIDLTYVSSGNGAGEIETVVYSLSSSTVATLTLAYNSSNKLISVTRS